MAAREEPLNSVRQAQPRVGCECAGRYKGEDTARRERYAAAAVQNGLMDYVTEADAVLDSLLDPQEFDLCDIG
jgi:hypothetical protein